LIYAVPTIRLESMTDIEAVRKLKSQLSSIRIALAKTEAREAELYATRKKLWKEAKDQGIANQSTLAKYSGVTDMIVSRALNEKED